MKKLLKLLAIFGLALIIAGCSSKEPTQNTSMLIKDPKILKQSPFDESVYYYLKDKRDFSQYSKVVVPTIPIKDSKDQVIDAKVKEDISNYFTNGLSNAANSIVNKNPGAGTLKLEIIVEKVNVAYEDLKFYNFIPVSLAVKAIGRGTGIEDKDLLVVIAMRLTDVNNQEIIALAVDSKSIENVNEVKEITLKKVQPILDEWISRFKLRIEDFSKGVYKDI